MKQTLAINEGNSSLLLLFAGWGSDPAVFASLRPGGYDVMIAWDYREPEFDTTLLGKYSEIVVAAWSFGVVAASDFMRANDDLPITLTVAFNGTEYPVDDLRGIPEKIFKGTLENLDMRNLAKFTRRMCGSADRACRYTGSFIPRAIDDLKDELTAIASMPPLKGQLIWDHAFISTEDRIIPTENQQRAWAGSAHHIHPVEGPHLPDIPTLLIPLLVNKSLVARRFNECRMTYDTNATVQRHVAQRLASMLPDTPLKNVIEIGCGTGALSRLLLANPNIGNLDLVDLNGGYIDGHTVKKADGETYLRKSGNSGVDAITSASTIQWFNSPSRFLHDCAGTVRPGGYVLLSTFGPKTYGEISGIVPSLHYLSPDEFRKIIPDSFDILTLDSETVTVKFSSPLEALRHMKLTGVNSIGNGTPRTVRALLREWPRDDSGQYPLTYQPIYILLKLK